MARQDSSETIRINLNVTPKYLEFFDSFAKDLSLSRSAAFTVLLRDYMRQAEILSQIGNLREIAEMTKQSQSQSLSIT